jgi:hypothetical protein
MRFMRRVSGYALTGQHAMHYKYMLQKTDSKTTRKKSHIHILRSDSSRLTQMSRSSNEIDEEMLDEREYFDTEQANKSLPSGR